MGADCAASYANNQVAMKIVLNLSEYNNGASNRLFINAVIGYLSWGIVAVFLLFLPFQFRIYKSFDLPHIFLWGDEVFCIVAFLAFYIILIYTGHLKKDIAQIIVVLFIIASIGIISGLLNNNNFVITTQGIFSYIKNFMFIPIFGLFRINKRRYRRLYNLLHQIALLLCFVGIFQEILYLFGVPLKGEVRFGILRVASLMGHTNEFGLYSLLFFILDYSLEKKFRWQNIVFSIGVLISCSRMVWVAYFLSYIYLLFHIEKKKLIIYFVILICILGVAFPTFYKISRRDYMDPENNYRGYCLAKALEICKDHPILGVGPGMFGGEISVVFNSPVYQKYDFSERWYEYGLAKFHSLDQFWAQLIGEIGLLGLLAFVLLLVLLWRKTKKASILSEDQFKSNILLGYSAIPIVLMVYLYGSGLNIGSFLITYSVLFGMCLGIKDENFTD